MTSCKLSRKRIVQALGLLVLGLALLVESAEYGSADYGRTGEVSGVMAAAQEQASATFRFEAAGNARDGLEVSSQPSGSPPTIIAIEFPSQVPTGGSVATGSVLFSDPDGDLERALFDRVDSGFGSFFERPQVAGVTQGRFEFKRICLGLAFATFRVTLFDAAGNRSEPKAFSYTCGNPPNSYDPEQENVRPTDMVGRVNFFILAGVETELEENARFATPDAPLGDLNPILATAFEKQIVPSMTGIYDQCGVAIQTGVAKVVRPEKLVLSDGRTLAQALDTLEGQLALGTRKTTDALRAGVAAISSILGPEGLAIGEYDRNIWIAGIGIRNLGGVFSGVGDLSGTISVVAWRYYMVTNPATAEIFPPKWVITLILHELGHNLGLWHSWEDGLAETGNRKDDPLDPNVMGYGSGLPGVFVPAQCEIIRFHLTPLTDTSRVPAIFKVYFPAQIPVSSELVWGGIVYSDSDGDFSATQFEVVKGDASAVFFDPRNRENAAIFKGFKKGNLRFQLSCTTPQQVTVKVTLQDAAGRVSAPAEFSFECKSGSG